MILKITTKSKLNTKGFTLVELLVVIAIIAILAAVVVLIVNPLELTRRGRDAARLSDLANLQQAINVAVQESTNASTYILCNGINPGPTGCAGNSNDVDPNVRKSNGTGWVKVNLGAQQSVSIPTLPTDPINSAAYRYEYKTNATADAWEIDAVLESQQQSPKMTTDGGNNNAKYEVGSDLTIIP